MIENRSPYPLGAYKKNDKIHYSYASKNADCGILIYKKGTDELLEKIPFLSTERVGHIYFKDISGYEYDKIEYLFYEGDAFKADPYGKAFSKCKKYGEARGEKDLKGIVSVDDFDWQDDVNPCIKHEDAIVYGVHVRGFSAHPSSKVQGKGTFAGLIQKIPYLKELGVTTLEFQPIYEFVELEEDKVDEISHIRFKERLNYWGYKRGYYFAPKAAYSDSLDAVRECKEMIRELHKNGLEAVLQFYFPNSVTADEIIEVLHFWLLNYHVDGFHLMGEGLPVTALAKDALLADTKLWFYDFDIENIFGNQRKAPEYKNLAVYKDDYYYQLRKYLKGDDNVLPGVLSQMREIPKFTGKVNCISNYYGFTLMDLVSYDRKHNEDNGENNQDGNDYNFSWNCGEEGKTRKKKVLSLRNSQIKNALSMLFFSAGTPFIFMGDEFGRTQKGNNNPYCHDDDITWVNWKEAEKNKEILEFFKLLCKLRSGHGVLRRASEARIMDSLSCGYPDLSYHGQNAWRLETDGYLRTAGLMYCGSYAVKPDGSEDDFLYFGMNMHWEEHMLALPRLPQGLKWKILLQTNEEEADTNNTNTLDELRIQIAPRSVCIYISVPDEKATRKKGKLPEDRQAF